MAIKGTPRAKASSVSTKPGQLHTALADTPEGIARVWFDSPHKTKLLATARALIDLDEASREADGTVGVEVGDTLSGIAAGAPADGANDAPENPAPDAVARRRVSAPNSTRNAALTLALPLAALAVLTLVPPLIGEQRG